MKTDTKTETPPSVFDLIKQTEAVIESRIKEVTQKAKDSAKKGKFDHASSYTAEAYGMEKSLGVFDGIKPEITKERALIHLCGYLTSGAGDTWSGRGNDLRREKHDAFLESARRFLDAIKYGWIE